VTIYPKEVTVTIKESLPTIFDDSAAGWERAIYAFLSEKERRSGSRRTQDSYYRMLQHFFRRLGKTPEQVISQDVFVFAHGRGLSGREPSAATIGARLSCLSSFYRFLIRMEMATVNPCDAVERPKVQPSPPRGLSAGQVRQLLDAIPNTVKGRRDQAIVLTLVLTGRRRSEAINLRAGDIAIEDGKPFYTYRGKGGKRGRRELPQPAFDAISRTLADVDKDMTTTDPEESLWQAGAGERGVTSATFYTRFRRYLAEADLPLSGVHILRHTAAKLRREVGESIESVSQFLDHASLGVTTTYLRRLEGQEDSSWYKVAEAIRGSDLTVGTAAIRDQE
jgi:site-specific recombinase XerD